MSVLQTFELEEVEKRVEVLFENCLDHINNGSLIIISNIFWKI